MTKEQELQLEQIRARWRMRRWRMRTDIDDDGRWVTTEDDHHIHINSAGTIDKGNPHVLAAIQKSMQRTAPLTAARTGTRVKTKEGYWTKQSDGRYKNADTGEVRKAYKIGEFQNCSKRVVKDQRGKDIDLGDSALEYTEPFNLHNEKAQKTIMDFEKKRRTNKIEYGMTVSENGYVLDERKGGKGSVKISLGSLRKGAIFSHIHPRCGEEEGCLGGTFSETDFSKYKYSDIKLPMRAAAGEGIYTFIPSESFDAWKFLPEFEKRAKQSETNKEHKKILKQRSEELAEINKEYKTGKLSYEDYSKKWNETKNKYTPEINRAANAYLVERHNILLEMQEEYHFTYYLEEWE